MWDVKVMILVDPVPHTPSRALQVLEKDTKKKKCSRQGSLRPNKEIKIQISPTWDLSLHTYIQRIEPELHYLPYYGRRPSKRLLSWPLIVLMEKKKKINAARKEKKNTKRVGSSATLPKMP